VAFSAVFLSGVAMAAESVMEIPFKLYSCTLFTIGTRQGRGQTWAFPR